MSDLNMPGHTDGVQGEDASAPNQHGDDASAPNQHGDDASAPNQHGDEERDPDVQVGIGEDAGDVSFGIGRTPPPPG